MPARTKRLVSSFLLIVLALARGSSPPPATAQGIYAGYIPHFPTNANNTAISLDEPSATTRWLGGDAAVEARLDADHSLWFFSDSFVSTNRGQGRSTGVYPYPGSSPNYSIPRNAIAIATHSRNGDQYLFTPQYYCRGSAGRYTAFLPDPAPPGPRSGREGWLWPRSALTYGQFVLVFAHRMVPGPDGGLRVNNSVVIRIDTRPAPTDPSRWVLRPLYLHRYPDDATADIVFGASCFLMKDPTTPTTYVGTYGSYTRGDTVTGLRIPLDSLLGAPAYADISLPYQGNTGAQYLKVDSTWTAGLYNPDALPVKNIPTDFYFTTRFVPDAGGGAGHWRAVLFQNKALYGYSPARTFTNPPPPARGPIPSIPVPAECQSAYITTSTAGPYGPFATPTPLARFPQMDPNNPVSYHPDILCYGVAEQPDFETTDSQILLTYSTHSNVAMVPGTNQQQSSSNVSNNPTGQFYTVFSQYATPPPYPTAPPRPGGP